MTFLKKLNYAIPFALVLLLLTLLWAELSSTRSYAYSSGIVGERVPNFSVPSLSGAGNITQKNLSGRVTLLNFFASWCSACRAEHPMLMKIKNKYGIPFTALRFVMIHAMHARC